jgi:hypothetical protein
VTDLVSRLLEAITAKEGKAEAAKALHVSFDMARRNGKATLYAFLDDNDPSSVLRRCAADRRRAERHAPSAPGIGPFESRRFKDPEARICAHCSHDGEWGAVEWPCPDFVDLADSYGLEVTE